MTDKTDEAVALSIDRRFRLSGYATGDYFCRCLHCGEGFIGDKRAVSCLPCAGSSVASSLASRDARIAELEKDVRDWQAIAADRQAGHSLAEARALKAEAALEDAVKAMKVAEHDLTTTHNLRSTDMSPDQMNDALKRGVALSDLEWMTDNSRGCNAIRATLTAIKGGE